VVTHSQTVAGARCGASSVGAADRAVLFGGSTHHGEEEILATMFLRLRKQFPPLRLFIAPRHVERLREVRAQLEALGLRVALASEVGIDRQSDADCILLDTT